MSKRHPQAGETIKITEGPLKGLYVKIIDFFQNQYQGKSMEKLYKTQRHFLDPVKQRGHPLDDKVIFCQQYPEMKYICIHNNELHGEIPKKEELPVNVEPINRKKKGKKDDK